MKHFNRTSTFSPSMKNPESMNSSVKLRLTFLLSRWMWEQTLLKHHSGTVCSNISVKSNKTLNTLQSHRPPFYLVWKNNKATSKFGCQSIPHTISWGTEINLAKSLNSCTPLGLQLMWTHGDRCVKDGGMWHQSWSVLPSGGGNEALHCRQICVQIQWKPLACQN